MSVPKYHAVDGKFALPEQSKYVSIYDNNTTTTIEPDPGRSLSRVEVYTNIPTSGGSSEDTYNLKALIQGWSVDISTLPDSISEYRPGAFYNATLCPDEITIPDNIESIGHRAFYESGITSVYIHDGVYHIGNEAFASNWDLTFIRFPKSGVNIGYGCCGGNGSLQSVELPEDMTEIPSNMFDGCSSLTSITIPESVTRIGNNAFSYCDSLTSITIPENAMSIEPQAFSGCNSLTDITIPESVTHIGVNAFENCNNLTSINIPDNIEQIGESAFRGCTNLESITIPNSLRVNSRMFGECTNLKIVIIKCDSVKEYSPGMLLSGTHIYDNHEGIIYIDPVSDDIDLDALVEEYRNDENHGWSQFADLIQPITMRDIVELSVASLPNKTTYPLNGRLILDGLVLNAVTATGKQVSVTFGYTVGEYDFSTEGTKTITISFNGASTQFEVYVDPTLIEYPESNHPYNNNEDYTWYYTHPTEANYLAITFSPETWTEEEYDYVNIYLADGSLYGQYCGDSLKSRIITIPGNSFSIQLTSDESSNGYGFTITNIEAVDEMPCDYIEIENYPYKTQYNVNEELNLEGLELYVKKNDGSGEYITEGYTVSEYDFSTPGRKTITIYYGGCSTNFQVEVLESDFDITDGVLIRYSGSNGGDVVIPDEVTSIGDEAFKNRTNITSITIPDGVTSIGTYAFANCFNLASINIPDSVTDIGTYAFRECSKLTTINIPDSVTSINDAMFMYCSSLEHINIPNSITNIGQCAFWQCSSLTSISIPDSVTNIGTQAFESCSNLSSVIIPNSITNIGFNTFKDCTSLTSITIPDCVTNIGGSAFYNCTNLTSITIPDSVTTISDNAFENCTNLTIYCNEGSTAHQYAIDNNIAFNCSSPAPDVPEIPDTSMPAPGLYETGSNYTVLLKDWDTLVSEGAVSVINDGHLKTGFKITTDEYDNETWSNSSSGAFPGDLLIPNDGSITSIGYGSFYKCRSLTGIVIPNGITTIYEYTFEDCINLTSVTIPDSVTTISTYAFYNCKSLTSITIPDGVTWIDLASFENCINLTSITIPDGATGIYDRAFYGCTNLTSITIPDSVRSITKQAFGDCTNLTDINYKGTKAQWDAITKGTDWAINTGSYTLHCTDGDYDKSGNLKI